MGKVTVKIKVQNWADVEMLAVGMRKQPARSIETDALVDTGATGFYLKRSLVERFGLRLIAEIKFKTMPSRRGTRRVFSPVDLEIQGRSRRFDVVELPDDLPNIVGQIPLEAMDWVVDMRARKLIGNPEHKGEEMYEEFFDGRRSRRENDVPRRGNPKVVVKTRVKSG